MISRTSAAGTPASRIGLPYAVALYLVAALAAASTAAAQSAVDPMKNGEVTVELEFESIPGGCRTSREPEVRMDGRVLSWRAPSFAFAYDTGNPTTAGWALRLSGVTAGSHTITVALPSDTCPGYGWLPTNRRTVEVNARNGYKAKAHFNYTRTVTPPTPERRGTTPSPTPKL
jgi:opacity protein-like surface antigen